MQGEVMIAVEDTGKGLTNEELSQLFNAKTHFSKNGTSGEKGSGIGLLLCQEMAMLSDGRIEVNSAPNSGCTFSLLLPQGQ